MNRVRKTGNWVLRHKCSVFLLAFAVYLAFFDQNSLLHRYKLRKQTSELKAELFEYRQKYERDGKMLDALRKDAAYVERVAREKYFMKTADEDVYVVVYPGEKNSGYFDADE